MYLSLKTEMVRTSTKFNMIIHEENQKLVRIFCLYSKSREIQICL